MSAVHQVLLGQSAATGYKIQNSLRFRANNSANATRTNAAAGNAQKATFSFWAKRGQLGSGQAVFGVYNAGSNYFYFGFTLTDQFVVLEVVTSTQYHLQTSAVFRDPTAWYHIVVAIDTTQATAANRVRIYANGVELTSFSTNSPPALNYNHTYLNANARVNYLGGNSALGWLDAHIAKFHYIEGQQLTPPSFGKFDSPTNVWVPIPYTGTYGTLGSLHEFEDATSTTTIVKDTSGNSNGYSSSGISVTAGTTFDQSLDTPTTGYPNISPINSQAVVTISEANTASNYGGVSNTGTCLVTMAFPTTGKWYYEHLCVATGASDYWAGVMLNKSIAGNAGNIIAVGTNSGEYAYRFNGNKMIAGVASAYGATYTANDLIGVAFDADNLTIEFFKNGVSQGQLTGMPAGQYIAFTQQYNGGSTKLNFGQRAFTYTPPTNFKALNTANLPTPSIRKGSLYMDATLRTGTGATASVSSLGFQPDLVWIKSRSAATDHGLYDAVRGVQKQLESNNTDAETTETTGLTAFSSNGYTVGALAQLNTSAATYVDWAWKEGVMPGFDIVTYVGNGTNRTISHNLGAVPHFIIVKNRTTSPRAWTVYHRNADASPASGALYLNLTDAFAADSTNWNNTLPTSSVFSVGTADRVNQNTDNLVAYLWSEIEGFSKFGSYTGNASTDGPFVWCGFRPRWIMVKDATTANLGWRIYDTVRETFNEMGGGLEASSAAAENFSTSVRAIDFLSSGFKIKVSSSGLNGSGVRYVFAAFAEVPFKYARAR